MVPTTPFALKGHLEEVVCQVPTKLILFGGIHSQLGTRIPAAVACQIHPSLPKTTTSAVHWQLHVHLCTAYDDSVSFLLWLPLGYL